MEEKPSNLKTPEKRTASSDGPLGDSPSTIDARRDLRVEARRRRVRERLTTLCLALSPVLLAGVYLLFLAAPQFAAESRFTVQAAQLPQGGAGSASSSSASPLSSLLSQGNGMASAATGFVDGWAVQDFLNSRDCMRQLDRKIGLRKYLAKQTLDPLSRLSKNADDDDLFNAYRRSVHNSYNLIEEINTLEVDGFSPSESTEISNGLLSVVQDFVNRMNQQGIDDALKVGRAAVAQAEQQDQAALAAISRWRIEHGNVDPTADATMLLNQVGLLESSLSTAEVNLVKIKALRNPDHPMLVPAQRQVDALRGRLYEIRSRLSGNGDTPAAQLKTYIELTNQQAFADSNVMQARQNYQQSFTNAMALQRYLSIIARPVSETRSSIPNPPVVMILAFGIGCALAAAHNLIRALYRSFRHA
jgi:capsular polysaccharide transport system permease protein